MGKFTKKNSQNEGDKIVHVDIDERQQQYWYNCTSALEHKMESSPGINFICIC